MIGKSPTNLMVCPHTHFSILFPRVSVPFPSEVGNNSKVGQKPPIEAEIFVLFSFLCFLLFSLGCLVLETVSYYVALASLKFVVFLLHLSSIC